MVLRVVIFLLALGLGQAASAAPLHFDNPQRWLTVGPNALGVHYTVLFGRVNGDKMDDMVLYNYGAGTAYAALSPATRSGRLRPMERACPSSPASPAWSCSPMSMATGWPT